MLDLALKNGLVCDPKNSIFSVLDVGIRNGRIAAVGSGLKAEREMDCKGLIVCPGFVDAHSHEDCMGDGRINTDITLRALRQGVTTMITGNCGDSQSDIPAYRRAYDGTQPVNMALLAGHSTIRRMCGADDKYAHVSKDVLMAMCDVLERQLTEGARGLSMGIRYVPGMTMDEMCAMAAVLRRFDGTLSAHIRGDAFEVYDAVSEFMDIGAKTGVRLQLSHIGSMAAFGQMESVLSYIDARAANERIDIMIDCYPYDAFCTEIGATTYDDGFLARYHDITRIEITDGEHKGFVPNMEVFQKVRMEHPEYLTVAHVMNACEVDKALLHPKTVLGSDGILVNGAGHPRAAGAFARFLSEYVLKRQLFSLPEGIAKMTYIAAERFGLDRGTLSVGSMADIDVIDPNEVRDRATFEEPALAPDGIKAVIIGGGTAVLNGEVVCAKLGHMI